MTQVVRLNNPFFLASTVNNAAKCSILGFIRQFRADPMHGFGGTPDIVCLIVNPFITSPKSESHGDLESISSIRLRLQGVFSMSLPWEASDTSRVKRPWRLGCGHVPQINKTWILRPRILQAESQKDCVLDSDHPCWITQVSLALASRIDCWWKTQLATCLLRCLQLVKDGRQIAWGGTWVLCCFQDQKHWRHWLTKGGAVWLQRRSQKKASTWPRSRDG